MLLSGMASMVRPAAALPVPPQARLEFRLMRHGDDIGRHAVAFEQRDRLLTVHIRVDAKVTFLAIPIVHYRHRATEIWRDDVLEALDGHTNKNGQEAWVAAHRTAEGLAVTGSQAARYIAPETAIATSYWNRRMLDGPMISLEDGKLLFPKVRPEGMERIRIASGASIGALRYDLSGAFDVDLWYEPAGAWASLVYTAADGSDVRYERL